MRSLEISTKTNTHKIIIGILFFFSLPVLFGIFSFLYGMNQNPCGLDQAKEVHGSSKIKQKFPDLLKNVPISSFGRVVYSCSYGSQSGEVYYKDVEFSDRSVIDKNIRFIEEFLLKNGFHKVDLDSEKIIKFSNKNNEISWVEFFVTRLENSLKFEYISYPFVVV